MSEPELTPREKDLVKVLQNADGPILVELVEDYHPATPTFQTRLREAAEGLAGTRLMEFSLQSCRNWAARHGIHGTPSVLVFQGGRHVGTLLGMMEATEMRTRLAVLLR